MEEYKNIKELQKRIREKGTEDYFKIDSVVYTMDNYDNEGKEITYANKKTFKGFSVFTEDRYENGFNDAIIGEIEDVSIRNDINYYE